MQTLGTPSHKVNVFLFSASGNPEPSNSGPSEDDIHHDVTKMIETKTETSEMEAEAQRLRLSCLNNLAACHFQWGHHASVIQLSSAVLDLNNEMVKALYRYVVVKQTYSDCVSSASLISNFNYNDNIV